MDSDVIKARAAEYVTKVEGHGSLTVDFKSGEARLIPIEGERLFEGIVTGKSLDEMCWITARICGVCPIAHNLASLTAGEAALGINISPTTERLRLLMQIGQNIQSHILHAVFLALPDYLGMDRATDLAEKEPKLFNSALYLKETGDEIARVVAGRSVHPTRTRIGGFHKVPTIAEFDELSKRLVKSISKAKGLLKLFKSLDYPALSIDLEFLAQAGDSVRSNRRKGFTISQYKRNITEVVKEGSSAKFGSFMGSPVMVGALARLYFLSIDDGGERMRVIDGLDFKNPFHNNLAQVMEVAISLEEALELTESLKGGKVDAAVASPASNPPLKGIGSVEAPRGGLYNEVHINKDGIIKYANIVTPTVQNLTSIEDSASALLIEHSAKSRKVQTRLIEMLIRAYDPCITCSTH